MKPCHTTESSGALLPLRRTLSFAFCSIISALLLSGCAGIGMTGMRETAQVRLVQASADSPAVDLYAGENALAYGLSFGTRTSYVPVAQGRQVLHADVAGSRQALSTVQTALTAGGQYTAIIGDTLGSLRLTLLPDQVRPAPAGQAALRVVDQAFRTGALDLYLVPAGSGPAGTAATVPGLAFGGVDGYRNVPAGSYSFFLVPAGVSPALGSASLLTTPQMLFGSGTVRTVIFVDRPGTVGGVQAIVNEEGEAARSE